jgi:hypothetical protein
MGVCCTQGGQAPHSDANEDNFAAELYHEEKSGNRNKNAPNETEEPESSEDKEFLKEAERIKSHNEETNVKL